MTLEHVFALDDRGLNIATAQRLGWEWITTTADATPYLESLKGHRWLVAPGWREAVGSDRFLQGLTSHIIPATPDLPIAWSEIDAMGVDFAKEWAGIGLILRHINTLDRDEGTQFVDCLFLVLRECTGRSPDYYRLLCDATPRDYARALCVAVDLPT